jgi:hypothetical protein
MPSELARYLEGQRRKAILTQVVLITLGSLAIGIAIAVATY